MGFFFSFLLLKKYIDCEVLWMIQPFYKILNRIKMKKLNTRGKPIITELDLKYELYKYYLMSKESVFVVDEKFSWTWSLVIQWEENWVEGNATRIEFTKIKKHSLCSLLFICLWNNY